jgi:hypothetical protein
MQPLGVERDYVRMWLAPPGHATALQCLQFWVVNAVGHLRFMLAFPREH